MARWGRKVWPMSFVSSVVLRVTMSLSVWGAIIRLVFLRVRTRAGTFVVIIGMLRALWARRWARLVRVGQSFALENRIACFSCRFLVE